MDSGENAEAARREKVLAAKKKLKQFQKNKSSEHSDTGSESTRRHDRRSSMASSVASDVSTAFSKSEFVEDSFAPSPPVSINKLSRTNFISPTLSPRILPTRPYSPMVTDSLSTPDVLPSSDLFPPSPQDFSFLAPVVSPHVPPHTPPVFSEPVTVQANVDNNAMRTIAVLMEEKQALTAELQKYADNELLLREGTTVVKALKSKNEELEKRLTSVSDQNDTLRKDIVQKEALVSNLTDQLSTQRLSLENTEKQLSTLRQDLQAATERERLLMQKHSSLSAQSNQTNTEQTELEQVITLKEENKKLEGRIQRSENDANTLRDELEKMTLRATELERTLENVKKDINRPSTSENESGLHLQVAKLQAELETLRRKNLETTTGIQETTDSLMNIQRPTEPKIIISSISELEELKRRFAELESRYYIILQENKELNELVEGEVFEGDEFGVGMHSGSGLDAGKLSMSLTAQYDLERRRILALARQSLQQLQARYSINPGKDVKFPQSDAPSLPRASFSMADRQAVVGVPPAHWHAIQVPTCSACVGKAFVA